ncbi:MAG: hypothetical protein ABW139_06635 [Candidatus Thiodiazotropha sp. DIVDIV]
MKIIIPVCDINIFPEQVETYLRKLASKPRIVRVESEVFLSSDTWEISFTITDSMGRIITLDVCYLHTSTYKNGMNEEERHVLDVAQASATEKKTEPCLGLLRLSTYGCTRIEHLLLDYLLRFEEITESTGGAIFYQDNFIDLEKNKFQESIKGSTPLDVLRCVAAEEKKRTEQKHYADEIGTNSIGRTNGITLYHPENHSDQLIPKQLIYFWEGESANYEPPRELVEMVKTQLRGLPAALFAQITDGLNSRIVNRYPVPPNDVITETSGTPYPYLRNNMGISISDSLFCTYSYDSYTLAEFAACFPDLIDERDFIVLDTQYLYYPQKLSEAIDIMVNNQDNPYLNDRMRQSVIELFGILTSHFNKEVVNLELDINEITFTDGSTTNISGNYLQRKVASFFSEYDSKVLKSVTGIGHERLHAWLDKHINGLYPQSALYFSCRAFRELLDHAIHKNKIESLVFFDIPKGMSMETITQKIKAGIDKGDISSLFQPRCYFSGHDYSDAKINFSKKKHFYTFLSYRLLRAFRTQIPNVSISIPDQLFLNSLTDTYRASKPSEIYHKNINLDQPVTRKEDRLTLTAPLGDQEIDVLIRIEYHITAKSWTLEKLDGIED